MSKALGWILLLAAATAPATAQAQEGKSVIVTISKADLALSDHKFRTKVSSAIEDVCGYYGSVEPYQWPEIDDCWKSAWASVNQQLAELKAGQTTKLGER